jgi:hemerythrin superfamily protein
MSAIDMLEAQHREVEQLFAAFEEASPREKQHIFLQIADKLAVHSTIEERHFYPACRSDETEDLLAESAEDHLNVERLISDLLEEDVDEETLTARMKVLQAQVQRHVVAEEGELFPRAKKLLDATTLEALERKMIATQEALLEEGQPRDHLAGETGAPGPI